MGSTLPPKNKITNLYPLTKFYIAMLILLVGVTLPTFYAKLAVFVLICVLAAVCGVGKTFADRMLKSVGLIVPLILLIQIFFYPGEDVLFSLGRFSATREGLEFAMNLSINLANISGSIIWLFAITTEKDFVLALEKQGMSSKASYVVLSTLQMVPILKKQSQVIMDAQRARGVETEGGVFTRAKVFVPTLVPLVLSSISGTEERALTLEARGFSLDRQKTFYYDINPQPIDRTVSIAVGVIAVIYLIGRVGYWLWA